MRTQQLNDDLVRINARRNMKTSKEYWRINTIKRKTLTFTFWNWKAKERNQKMHGILWHAWRIQLLILNAWTWHEMANVWKSTRNYWNDRSL